MATAIKSAALGFLTVSIILVAALSLGAHSPRLMNGGGHFVAEAAGLIDARIQELGDWRGKMLSRLRALVKEADPEVVEEWKWIDLSRGQA